MGITVAPLPEEIADQLDLPIRGGVIVVRLRAGQSAEAAGLQKGDVIVKLADQVVRSPADLASIVEQLPIDQPQTVTVLRETMPIELSINLLEKATR
jgi:S1-C subfamily serine protease